MNAQKLQRMIENRLFAIRNSPAADMNTNEAFEDEYPVDSSKSIREQFILNQLEENLRAADAAKFEDGYHPLITSAHAFKKPILFIKRAMRKLLKMFWGWYIFPIYGRQSFFNGKILNTASLLTAEATGLKARVESLAADNSALRELLQEIHEKQENESKRLETHLLVNVEWLVANNKTLETRLNDMFTELTAVNELSSSRQLENTLALKDQIDTQEAQIAKLMIRVEKAEDTLKSIQDENAVLPLGDEFYHDFEEKFRGSFEIILDRLRSYLPDLKALLPDWSCCRCIDVGSGRGEWLDILREIGVTDYVGVDFNSYQNEIARTRGHNVICDDCIAYLKGCSENSIDLLTGFQIIEHLSSSALIALFEQGLRILKPGGVILFETQNPRNLMVGADTFYIDPSHRKPLEPEFIKFIASWIGYTNVSILDRNSHPFWSGVPLPDKNDESYLMIQRFNEVNWLLYGPMDYAILAQKRKDA